MKQSPEQATALAIVRDYLTRRTRRFKVPTRFAYGPEESRLRQAIEQALIIMKVETRREARGK